MTWWSRLWRRKTLEQDLSRELQFHVAERISALRNTGLGEDEARRRVRLEFGGIDQVKEDCRDARGIRWFDETCDDLQFAVRTLRRSPGFTAIAILTLALGAGANALIFTLIDSVVLRPLPYPESHQLVSLNSVQADGNRGSTSVPNFLDLQKQSQSFSALSAYHEKSASLRLPSGEPVHSAGAVVSTNLFGVLGVSPMLGHSFGGAKDSARPCDVLVSAAFWREHLSAGANVLGKNLTVDGKSCSISGVMPVGFTFPSREDEFWIALKPSSDAMNRGASFLDVIGRLKPGVTLAAAQTEVRVVARRLEQAYPDDNKGVGFELILYRDRVVGDARPALFALFGAVAVLLLIACANIANMQLARALGRKREMAIRAALGASRMRVVRQLFNESFVLAIIGTGAGLAFAGSFLGLLKRVADGSIPRVQEVQLRPEICVAMLIVAGISALFFGLAPVWHAARQNIERALRESAGAVASSRNQEKLRGALVVSQLSLTIILLGGSGLLLHTLYRLLHVDSGFVAERVLTMQTAVSGMEPPDKSLATTIYGPELDQIEEIPGVKAAGFVTFLPLSNGSSSATFFIGGRPQPNPKSQPRALLNAASEDYFRALRVPLLSGRFLKRTDTLDQPRVAIVNDILAKRYFPGENPVGKQIAFDDADFKTHPITIVGVVKSTRQTGLAKPPDAQLYLAFRQVPPATLWSQFLLKQIMTYVVRVSNGDPMAVSKEVQRIIHRVDPGQTTFHVATMQEIVSVSVQSRRLGAILASVLAGLALVIAVAGVYGVLSYIIMQRKRDIAVRMALGANRTAVVRMIVSRALLLYSIGLAIGLVGIVWSGHLLSSLLIGTQSWDPAAIALTMIVVLLSSLMAAWFPARRAASIDPYEALRSE